MTSLGSSILPIGNLETQEGRALLLERYASLQQQIPLLYLMISVNYLGLNLAMTGSIVPPAGAASCIFAFVLLRLGYWLWHRNRQLPVERVYSQLKTTLLLTVFISCAFSVWSLYLFDHVDAGQRQVVIFFAALTGIGCVYGLSSFPTAARIPIILVAAPLAFRLLFSGEAILGTIGASIGLASALTLRMLSAHEESFNNLVRSRSEQIAERQRARAAEAEARKIADTDHLTQMPNRRAFLRALKKASRDADGASIAVAMIDLDGFKPINDTFGHGAGDAVLKKVGERLGEIAGPEGMIARMGGDEFALLHRSIRGKAEADRLGRRICAALSASIPVEQLELRISGSCGIAVAKPSQRDPLARLAEADSALYAAKQKGPGCWAVFDPAMQKQMRRRSRLEQMLRDPAIERQLDLVLQPIFELEGLSVTGFEALARWQHPKLGLIPPDEFIRIAEHIDIVDDLTEALFIAALREAARWPAHLKLSFNLSARQLCSRGSPERLVSIIRSEKFDPRRLQMEITETALLADFDAARENLRKLRSAGVQVVLDDFGAGHASISYLQEMQFDAIKLDGSLLRTASRCTSSERLLRGIVDLCASIRTPCVAEHIETKEQLQLLQEIGCPSGQGFFLSRPLQPLAALALARVGTSVPAARSAA
ncbi:MAG TPA: EAL domain-containing protein [Allosphingosinicella sp.]|nr:EAL domain-containing protein [Allosphingosinicella sp.]